MLPQESDHLLNEGLRHTLRPPTERPKQIFSI
jgi:hypothetical protein